MTAPSDLGLPKAEFLLYQTEDGETRVEVRFDGENAWLTQASMAELYQTSPQNITQHIAAIYEEGRRKASWMRGQLISLSYKFARKARPGFAAA